MELTWLTDDARIFLERGYLRGQTPEERFEQICETILKISKLDGIDNRFREYISKGWVSFASPVLSNFGHAQNLPISCNHGRIADNLDSILNGLREVGMLSKYGAGVAINFSSIRPIGSKISSGGKSEGIMPFIEIYDHLIDRVSQNGVRRGFLSAYLKTDHPEISEFLDIGSEGHKIKTITTAVTIPKGWMESLKNGDRQKRTIWAKILKRRSELGFPYILFEENCNINSPQVYHDKNLWLDNGNICIEAIEYCDIDKTFACCLSSVNLQHYNEWKNHPSFIFDMNIMLDCVIEEYIQKGAHLAGLGRAVKFAKEHRAIGLGVLGFHTLLQQKQIPIGTLESYSLNNEIFKYLRQEGDRASEWMAKEWGEPKMMEGYGLRNSSRIAVAPTKSTSFLMGQVSSGIEPIKSNYHEQTLAKIQVEYKNPELIKVLEAYGKNTKTTWSAILKDNGSVQKLDFLSQHEKDVFKTFSEVSQMDLIKLAAQRQKYIDMGQSLNLMFHPDTPPKELNKITLAAYEEGIKSLYYQYTISAAQEFNKKLLECTSCEG